MSSTTDPLRAAAGPELHGVDPAIHARRWAILAVLCLSLLLIVAGNSSLNVALPDIQKALHSSPSQQQWMVDAYSFVFAVLLLPAGALADRHGRKTALQVGLAIFALASLAAARSQSNTALIAWRGVTGMGAAFIMPGTLSILTNVFRDPRERQRAIAVWAGCAGLGGALGPIATGVLLAHFHWPSTFGINVAICGVALLAGAFLLPNSADPHETTFDPLGVLFAIGGVGGLLYGIIEGPSAGWTDVVTLAPLAVGIGMVVAFVLWERHNPRPMLDVRLFAVRPFQVGSTTITLQFFAMYGLYFAVAQYLQISHGYSPLRAAVACLPIGGIGMVSAPLSANLVRRFGHRRVVGSGLLLSATGLAAMGWVTPTTTYVLLGLAFLCMGFGNGQTTAPSTTLIMSSVPRAKSGVGSAVNDLSRELGGALGIATLGSVISSVYRASIPHHVSPALAARAGTSVGVTLKAARQAFAAHDPATGQALLHGARATFAHGFGVAMILGALVLVLNSMLVWARALRAGTEDRLPVPEAVPVAEPAELRS